jgi:hypothetical protein
MHGTYAQRVSHTTESFNSQHLHLLRATCVHIIMHVPPVACLKQKVSSIVLLEILLTPLYYERHPSALAYPHSQTKSLNFSTPPTCYELRQPLCTLVIPPHPVSRFSVLAM